MSQPAQVIAYPGEVWAIDSTYERPCMAACYLMTAGNEAAVIETGTNHSVPGILAALDEIGLARASVKYVIVTHVHLDHAGGAGTLMQHLPSAKLLVHPRGSRHMVDPGRLEASVRQVYGDAYFDQAYGRLVPVTGERVEAVEDGATVELGGRVLRFMHTPGHADHHFCVHDGETNGWFSGDTFGLSYRELDTSAGPFIFPTTTPIQFRPEALINSIDALMAESPKSMYLTHFGCVGDLVRLAADLRQGVAAFVDIARTFAKSPDRTSDIEKGMMDYLQTRARQHGVSLEEQALFEVMANDVRLNTQGLEFWLEHGG